MSDLASLSVSEIRSGLDSKQFSCTEITKACLEKAERLSSLNCFTLLTPEQIGRAHV